MWAAPCDATHALRSPLRSIMRLTYWRGSQSWRRGPLSRKPRVQPQRNFLQRQGERGEPTISSFIPRQRSLLPRHKITALPLSIISVRSRLEEKRVLSKQQGGCLRMRRVPDVQICPGPLTRRWAQQEGACLDQEKHESSTAGEWLGEMAGAETASATRCATRC